MALWYTAAFHQKYSHEGSSSNKLMDRFCKHLKSMWSVLIFLRYCWIASNGTNSKDEELIWNGLALSWRVKRKYPGLGNLLGWYLLSFHGPAPDVLGYSLAWYIQEPTRLNDVDKRSISSWCLDKVLSNERSHYICNVFSHLLRPCLVQS